MTDIHCDNLNDNWKVTMYALFAHFLNIVWKKYFEDIACNVITNIIEISPKKCFQLPGMKLTTHCIITEWIDYHKLQSN